MLSEQEVVARIEEARSAKSRLNVQNRSKPTQPKPSEEEEQQRQWEQKQIEHHLEQQGLLYFLFLKIRDVKKCLMGYILHILRFILYRIQRSMVVIHFVF